MYGNSNAINWKLWHSELPISNVPIEAICIQSSWKFSKIFIKNRVCTAKRKSKVIKETNTKNQKVSDMVMLVNGRLFVIISHSQIWNKTFLKPKSLLNLVSMFLSDETAKRKKIEMGMSANIQNFVKRMHINRH